MYMPSGNHYYLNTPVILLNGIQLAFVRTYKYLGTVMTSDNADDSNMRRQRGICYARANGIIKNFSMCSPVVKATLFRTFCSNMYCSQLWRDYKSSSIKQLIVGYNHSFRFIMNYHRNCSASGMFVFNSIPSFMELWRNYIIVLCNDSTTATIQSSLPLFRPVGCHPLCGGAGSLIYILKPAAFSSFLSCYFFYMFFFYCSCDRHLGLYYVSVFDQCLYHKCIVC